LRIISGIYKSRRLSAPEPASRKESIRKDNVIRPTSDRARETLFDILSSRVDLYGKNCLDLYAGTGALGIECLSRGAAQCSFVDNSFKSIQLISKNLNSLGCSEIADIYNRDVFTFLKENENEKYDVIFADPPYSFNKYDELTGLVLNRYFIIFVIEHVNEHESHLEDERTLILHRKSGKTRFTIFIR
jgi:16S rRNA (guanine966-N2)-methyltransferase